MDQVPVVIDRRYILPVQDLQARVAVIFSQPVAANTGVSFVWGMIWSANMVQFYVDDPQSHF